jgi:(S)-2-hydroxy-acid oxidase
LDFANFRIRPRFLRDVSQCDMKLNVFGSSVSFPCGISPTAMQKMAHEDGELATARGEFECSAFYSITNLQTPIAAASENVVLILSTIATTSIEDVAAAAPNATRWFQLYIYKDRKLTESIVRRAEKAGFKALVLTVDAPLFGLRRSDLRNKFSLPPHLTLANFQDVVTSMGGESTSCYKL